MLNLIKMNLFKMCKRKNTWVICAVSLALTLLLVVITKIAVEYGAGDIKTINFYNEFLDMFLELMPVYVILFSVAFVADEYSSKYNNNTFGITTRKYKFVINNIITVAVFLVMIFVITLIPTLVLELILNHSILEFTGLRHFICALSANMVLYLAIGVVFMFLATLMRKGTPSTIGLVYYLFFNSLLYMLIDLLLKKLKLQDFHFRKYILFGNLGEISEKCNGNDLLRCVIVAVVFIVVFAAGNTMLLTKRDL